jgi:hypothetical protein
MLRASKGRTFEQTREFLGHTDGATTRRYVASYNWDVAEAVAAMPDPRNGHRPQPDPAVSETWLPVDLADQLGAALAVLDRHGEQVAQAMLTVGKVTHLAWLLSLGLERAEQLGDVDPDALTYVSDEAWEAFELESGIRRGWELCDQLRDAYPDNH